MAGAARFFHLATFCIIAIRDEFVWLGHVAVMVLRLVLGGDVH